MTPPSSWPSVNGQGSGFGQWPFRMCRSVPQTPQAPILISAAFCGDVRPGHRRGSPAARPARRRWRRGWCLGASSWLLWRRRRHVLRGSCSRCQAKSIIAQMSLRATATVGNGTQGRPRHLHVRIRRAGRSSHETIYRAAGGRGCRWRVQHHPVRTARSSISVGMNAPLSYRAGVGIPDGSGQLSMLHVEVLPDRRIAVITPDGPLEKADSSNSRRRSIHSLRRTESSPAS